MPQILVPYDDFTALYLFNPIIHACQMTRTSVISTKPLMGRTDSTWAIITLWIGNALFYLFVAFVRARGVSPLFRWFGYLSRLFLVTFPSSLTDITVWITSLGRIGKRPMYLIFVTTLFYLYQTPGRERLRYHTATLRNRGEILIYNQSHAMLPRPHEPVMRNYPYIIDLYRITFWS